MNYVDRETGEVRAPTKDDYDRIRVDLFRAGTPASANGLRNIAERERLVEVASFIGECASTVLNRRERPGTSTEEAMDALARGMRALGSVL